MLVCVYYVSPGFDSDSASDGSVGSAALQLRYNDGAEPSETRGLTSLVGEQRNGGSADFFWLSRSER